MPGPSKSSQGREGAKRAQWQVTKKDGQQGFRAHGNGLEQGNGELEMRNARASIGPGKGVGSGALINRSTSIGMQAADPGQYKFDENYNIIQVDKQPNVEDQIMVDDNVTMNHDESDAAESSAGSDTDAGNPVDQIQILKTENAGWYQRNRFWKMLKSIAVKMSSTKPSQGILEIVDR